MTAGQIDAARRAGQLNAMLAGPDAAPAPAPAEQPAPVPVRTYGVDQGTTSTPDPSKIPLTRAALATMTPAEIAAAVRTGQLDAMLTGNDPAPHQIDAATASAARVTDH